jgi:hypothetical protein
MKLATVIAALVALPLFGAVKVAKTEVRRVSLFGYAVDGRVLSRDEAIDALANLLDRIRSQAEEMAMALRSARIAGSLHLAPMLTGSGARIEITARVEGGDIHTLRADRALALGIVVRVLRDAGLDAQRDHERGVVTVTG